MEINFDQPWVIFEIRKQNYAISTRLVTGIMQVPHIIHVANAPELFLGAINVRGEVFPLLDTRKLLGCPSADREAEETVNLLEEKKEELGRWIGLLRRSVEGGRRFPLPMEPTTSAFGKWYHEYVRKGSGVAKELKSIGEPLIEMHSYAKKVDSLRASDNSYGEGAEELLDLAEKCSQRIESCIDGITQSIHETLTPMIISLSFPSTRDTCMAFTVDSVKAVDMLSLVDERGNSKCLFVSGYLCGVAHNDKTPGEILLMDDLEIVKLVKLYHDSVRDQEPKGSDKKDKKDSEKDEKDKKDEKDSEKSD